MVRALAALAGVVFGLPAPRLSRLAAARGLSVASACAPSPPPPSAAVRGPFGDIGRRAFGSSAAACALGSALAPAPAADAALAGGAVTAAAAGTRVFAVRTPALELRAFRALLLPNGLRVLLASDPAAERAAAALCVRAGYFDDPDAVPGLAHFCEHMLFLGTRKYPAEDSFDSLINSAAGSNNAYTASESTCYFFDVDAPRLGDALDRFAQFFVKDGPLFTPSATARELNAIESEHSKNLQADSWREQEVLKRLSAELSAEPPRTRGAPAAAVRSSVHPYAKFGTGNKRTLDDEPLAAGVDVRAALLSYYHAKYSAERMALVIVGNDSLDRLQALAERCFAAVPRAEGAAPVDPACAPIARGAAFGDAGGPGDRPSDRPDAPARGPFGPLAPFGAPPIPIRGGGPALCIVPVSSNTQSISLTWAVPMPDDARVKPDYLFRQLIGRRDDGSLWAALRARGLVTDIGAYAIDEFGKTALARIAVELSDLGVSRWEEVATTTHAYLAWLRASVCARDARGGAAAPAAAAATFFADTEAIAALGFEYAEVAEPPALAESLAPQLFDYAPEFYFAGPATLADGGASAAAFCAFARALVPSGAVTLVNAKSFGRTATDTEPIYGTKYGRLDGRALQRAAERAAERAAARAAQGGGFHFAFPPRNPFVPDPSTLALKTAPSAAALRAAFARSDELAPLGASILPAPAPAPSPPPPDGAQRGADFERSPGAPRARIELGAHALGRGGAAPASPIAGSAPAADEGPWVVTDSVAWRVHCAPLPRFRRPFVTLRAYIGSPLVRASGGADGIVCAKVWASLLSERLESQLQQALAAGCGWEVSASDSGLVIGARGWGYDEATFGQLVDAIVSAVKQPLFEPARGADRALGAAAVSAEREAYARFVESAARDAQAFDTAPPLQQGGYAIRLLLDQGAQPVERTRDAIRALTADKVRDFAAAFCAGPLYGEALLCGNIDAADARALSARLRAALGAGVGGASVLGRDAVPRRVVTRVPLASAAARSGPRSGPAGLGVVLAARGRNRDEKNGATQVFWQVGARRARAGGSSGGTVASARYAALEVLAQLLEQPAYSTLRTKEQLGYAVGAGISEVDGAVGMFIAVQSAVAPPLAVAARIDAFLRDFDSELAKTSSVQLGTVVVSLARAKREKARRLAQQAGRFWLEVARGEYLFSRAEEEAAALERVQLDDVVRLYRERILPGGASVRRITALVEPAAGAAARREEGGLANVADVTPVDPLALRETLGVLARPRVDEDVDGP